MLNIFKRFTNANNITKSNDAATLYEFIRNSNYDINNPTINSYQARNLIHGLISTCIDTRASIYAQSIPLIYRNVAGNDTRKNKIVEDHPFVELLYNPNQFTSYYELMIQTISNLDAWGNCYWYINRGNYTFPNGQKIPTGIQILNHNFIKYTFDSNGYPNGFEYTPYNTNMMNNNKISKQYFELNDVIHFKYPGYEPNSLYGLSIIQKNVNAIEIYHYETNYQKSLLKNGGAKSEILKAKKKLSDAQMQELSTKWKDNHSGVNNAGKVLILPEYLEYSNSATSFNPMEIGYLESKKVSKLEILNMFRVHPAMIGDADGVNKANGYIGKNTFLEDVLTPIAKMIDAKITQFIKRTYNPKFYFEQKLPFKLNEEQEIKRYDLGLKTGSISKNEYRTFMDYNELNFNNINENDFFSNKYTVNDNTNNTDNTDNNNNNNDPNNNNNQ